MGASRTDARNDRPVLSASRLQISGALFRFAMASAGSAHPACLPSGRLRRHVPPTMQLSAAEPVWSLSREAL